MTFHRASLALLYLLTILVVVYLIAVGGGYYILGETQRPLHPLDATYKPSGLMGHGLGIIGSVLMVVMLLYSARKRFKWMQNWGNIRYWLNYHIWMGIAGPLLVIFHTTFKLGGIVAVSFWSMIGVAVSGVVGRYIYIQIPRSRTGQQFSATELEEMDAAMMRRLAGFGVGEETLRILQTPDAGTDKGGWGEVWKWWIQDLMMPFKLRSIRRALAAEGKVTHEHIRDAVKIVRQRLVLRRRIRFLHSAEGLLNYWHVIHKPFAYVMLVIMVVHTVVAILFGYKWIWSSGGY